jgi:two-component system, NarL family, invasion response regulator UvrY
MIRILIADDHSTVRRGLKEILLDAFIDTVIEEVGNGMEVIQKAREEKWDIIISDLSMPGKSGLEAMKILKMEFPKLPVLILSMHPEERYAIRALRAGAAGYLTKDSASDELVTAVRNILSGKRHITPTVAEKLAQNLAVNDGKALHETLSDREFDVFKLLASGKTSTEIAAILSVAITTVSTYRSRILVKMNLRTNADLTQYAIEHDLIEQKL